MSKKIIVSVYIGFAVVASCAIGTFFYANSQRSERPAVANATASDTRADRSDNHVSPSGYQNATPHTGAVTSSSNVAAAESEAVAGAGAVATAGVAAVATAGAAGAVTAGPQAQTRTVPVAHALPTAQASVGMPAPIQAAPSTVIAPTQPRNTVAVLPPKTQQPSLQAILPKTPTAPPPRLQPQVPPSVAAGVVTPKQTQAVEAVVVTGQRPQQMARTDVDSIGRGNSLTIQLPKRRK